MFKLLAAFFLLCSLATLAQRTTEGVENERVDDKWLTTKMLTTQGKGPNANSGKPKRLIVFKSKSRPLLCLGTKWDSYQNATEMFWCENGTLSQMSFTQFRYGDDGVFLMKQNNDLGRCHEVQDNTTDTCNRTIFINKTCDVTKEGQRFRFEAYGDEGYGIVRLDKNISDKCSELGPPSFHLQFGTSGITKGLAAALLAPATEEAKEHVLWKIKTWECRKEP